MPESYDKAVRHQVEVRRFSAHEVLVALALLKAADLKLVKILRQRLPDTEIGTKRFRKLLQRVKKLRKKGMDCIDAILRGDLKRLAKLEARFELRLLKLPKTKSQSITTPYAGRTLTQWLRIQRAADTNRITQALQLGKSEHRSTDDIIGLLKDVLSRTKQNVVATVRTAVTYVTNKVREAFWGSGIDFLRWTSILDGATSAICRGRDGHLVKVGSRPIPKGQKALKPQGARPPAHPNCRSMMVAVPAGEALPDIETYGE